jgi:hypothetical protein
MAMCHVISDFHRDVDEICALLGYYAMSSGNTLPTFQDNVSVPFSRVKSKTSYPSKIGPCCLHKATLNFWGIYCIYILSSVYGIEVNKMLP